MTVKYINWEVESPEEIEAMFDESNEIYFLFDNYTNRRICDSNVAKYAMLNPKKGEEIKFSFTLLEELKHNSLSPLRSIW